MSARRAVWGQQRERRAQTVAPRTGAALQSRGSPPGLGDQRSLGLKAKPPCVKGKAQAPHGPVARHGQAPPSGQMGGQPQPCARSHRLLCVKSPGSPSSSGHARPVPQVPWRQLQEERAGRRDWRPGPGVLRCPRWPAPRPAWPSSQGSVHSRQDCSACSPKPVA